MCQIATINSLFPLKKCKMVAKEYILTHALLHTCHASPTPILFKK